MAIFEKYKYIIKRDYLKNYTAMKDSKIMFFLLGAAVGAAAAYILSSDNKDEILEEVKNTAKKVKDEIDNAFSKGSEIVEEFQKKNG